MNAETTSATSFTVSVFNPEKVVVKDLQVRSLSAKGVAGEFEILPQHADFITQLLPGPVVLRTPDGEKIVEANEGGFLKVESSRTTVLLVQ